MKHAAYAHNLNPVIDWVEATDLEDATNATDPEKYRRPAASGAAAWRA